MEFNALRETMLEMETMSEDMQILSHVIADIFTWNEVWVEDYDVMVGSDHTVVFVFCQNFELWEWIIWNYVHAQSKAFICHKKQRIYYDLLFMSFFS